MIRLLFWRRRRMSDFADAIRPELEAIPTPDPTEPLLERILASRASSVRVILPEALTPRSRVSSRAIVAITVAAGALLMLVPATRRAPTTGDDVFASSGFLAREAFAQPADYGTRRRLAQVALARSKAIRPLTLEFLRGVHDTAGQLVNESVDSLAVATATVAGTPVWQITSRLREVVGTQRRAETETLYVARADLRFLSRAVHVAPYSRFERINVQQRFQGDSVTGRMTTDGPSIGAGRPIARRLRPELGPYLTGAFLPLALMTVPVSSTWSASAALLGWAVVPRDVYTPIELRVEGEEHLTVPAGTFDCWRLSIRFSDGEISYWMRKGDGLGVRVLDRRNAANGIRETVLRRVIE
jgi:hypothetical protein